MTDNSLQNKASKQFLQSFWSFFPVLSLAAVDFNIHVKVQPQRDNFESWLCLIQYLL